MVFIQVLTTDNYSPKAFECPSYSLKMKERTKNMGIGSYCVPSNIKSNHQDYWESASWPTPENATDAKECG